MENLAFPEGMSILCFVASLEFLLFDHARCALFFIFFPLSTLIVGHLNFYLYFLHY